MSKAAAASSKPAAVTSRYEDEAVSSPPRPALQPQQSPHTLRLLKLIQQGTLEHAQQATHILVNQVGPSLSSSLLWDLIGRLAECCLFHADYQSRQNASVGIQGIVMLATAIGPHDEEFFINMTCRQQDVTIDGGQELTVETVLECLEQILAEARPLYARSEDDEDTDEYDLIRLDEQRANRQQSTDDDDATKNSFLQQRLAMQQEILQRRLGLAGLAGHAAGLDLASDLLTDDVVSSQDLQSRHEPVAKRRRVADSKFQHDPKLRVLLVMELEELLRRRQRESDNGHDKNNPQTLLASEVIYRMLDPKWEIRHGATLACLGLVRAWYCQSGNPIIESEGANTMPASASSSSFGAWPQQVMARCLCVLALDRFGDFSLGNVVAPVRESAGQLLSVLVIMAPRNIQQSTLHVLFRLTDYEQDWDVRYGAMAALKFVAVLFLKRVDKPEAHVNVAHATNYNQSITLSGGQGWYQEQAERIAKKAVDCLTDKSDDIKSIAAKILATYLQQSLTLPELAYQAARPLWTTLRDVSSLSPCVPGFMLLLALLVEHDCDRLLLQIGSEGKVAEADQTNTIRTVSLFVIQLLDSDEPSVRFSAMRCIQALAKSMTKRIDTRRTLSNENETVDVYAAIVNRVFRTFFERGVDSIPIDYDNARPADELRDGAWDTLVSGSAALLHHSEALKAVEMDLLLQFFGVKYSRPRVGVIFGETARAAEALGSFLGMARKSDSSTLSSLATYSVAAFLQSPWPNQFEAACFLVAAIASKLSPNVISDKLWACLNGFLGSKRPNCLRYVTALGKVDECLDNAAIRRFCDEAFVKGSSLLSDDSYSGFDVALTVEAVWLKATGKYIGPAVSSGFSPSVLSVSVDATIAGALLAIKLPSKLTPLIRALVTSAKNQPTEGISYHGLPQVASSICMTGRAEHTSRCLKELILSIDNDPEYGSTQKKLTGTLCDLACNGNPIASQAVRQIVTAWSPRKLLPEIDVIWDRLQACRDVESLMHRDKRFRAIALLGIVGTGIYPGSLEDNKHAMGLFIPSLVQFACSSSEIEMRQSCLSTLHIICNVNFRPNMGAALALIRESLHRQTDDARRQSACIVLDRLVTDTGLDICPFVRVLLPDVLSLLTDPLPVCAGLASNIFATLVRAAPLVRHHDSVRADDKVATPFGESVIDHLILGQPMPAIPYPRLVQQTLELSQTLLRGYQKEGITWLRFLQSVNLSGALCDSMGIGKSVQALSAVAISHLTLSDEILDAEAVSLIVCPASVVGHFMQEIEKFFPGKRIFRSLCYVGLTSVRRKLWDTMMPNANLVVTSYSVLRSDIDLLASKQWRYCVLDEGHLLKNPKTATAQASRRIRARHRLITTGTIIQNHVNELWAAFDFLMPNFLGDFASFSANFAKPITKGQLPGASASAISDSMEKLKSLHQQCLPFILRRDKDKVLRELPPKIVSTVPVPMSALQTKIYQALVDDQGGRIIMAKLQQMLETNDAVHGDAIPRDEVLKKLLLLRLVCTHPALISQTNSIATSMASGGLGLEASGKLLALVGLLRESGIYVDVTSGADNDRSLLFCGNDDKSDDFDDLVESTLGTNVCVSISDSRETSPSKCIIFAQFSKSLDVVEDLVLNRLMPSVSYVRLDGRVPTERRADLANSFNRDQNVRVMLATTRVGGLGLNLTGADMVIFLESDMNPHADLQAMDRAHRIGQERVVNVYNLVTKDSIEEKIMLLQKKKVAMSEAIVNTENSTMYSMGTERLLDIFTTRAEESSDNTAGLDLDALAEQVCQEYTSLSMKQFLSSLENADI